MDKIEESGGRSDPLKPTSLNNNRLTAEECKEAIKMCKLARPMADAPSVKVFPYLSKVCPCCFMKQKKV